MSEFDMSADIGEGYDDYGLYTSLAANTPLNDPTKYIPPTSPAEQGTTQPIGHHGLHNRTSQNLTKVIKDLNALKELATSGDQHTHPDMVTRLIAGTGVVLDPATGIGEVTITATGGGSGGGETVTRIIGGEGVSVVPESGVGDVVVSAAPSGGLIYCGIWSAQTRLVVSLSPLAGALTNADGAPVYAIDQPLPASAEALVRHYFLVGDDGPVNPSPDDPNPVGPSLVPVPETIPTCRTGDWVICNAGPAAADAVPLLRAVSGGWALLAYSARSQVASDVAFVPLEDPEGAIVSGNVQDAIEETWRESARTDHTHEQYLDKELGGEVTGSLTVSGALIIPGGETGDLLTYEADGTAVWKDAADAGYATTVLGPESLTFAASVNAPSVDTVLPSGSLYIAGYSLPFHGQVATTTAAQTLRPQKVNTTVTTMAMASGVLTVTTSAAHGAVVGDWVSPPQPYSGFWKVTSVPTTTTLTCLLPDSYPDAPSAPPQGTATMANTWQPLTGMETMTVTLDTAMVVRADGMVSGLSIEGAAGGTAYIALFCYSEDMGKWLSAGYNFARSETTGSSKLAVTGVCTFTYPMDPGKYTFALWGQSVGTGAVGKAWGGVLNVYGWPMTSNMGILTRSAFEGPVTDPVEPLTTLEGGAS